MHKEPRRTAPSWHLYHEQVGPGAYVGGYNPCGQVVAGTSSSEGCGEDDVVQQGAETITGAFGWRGGEWVVIPVCENARRNIPLGCSWKASLTSRAVRGPNEGSHLLQEGVCGMAAINWAAIPGPKYYHSADVEPAIQAIIDAPAQERDPGAALRDAVGNDHGGTLYPAAVAATSRLVEIIEDRPGAPRRAALVGPSPAMRPFLTPVVML
jgi:hypothetical protein